MRTSTQHNPSPHAEDFPPSKNPLEFFWYTSRPHRVSMIAAIVAVSTAAVLGTFLPYTFKMLVDATIALMQGSTYAGLMWAAIAYISISSVRELIWRVSGFAGAYWATGVRATARDRLSAYLTLHSRDYFSNRFAGALANKISHAATGMRDFVQMLLWQFLSMGIAF
ncbi:MAG: hypothetical protein WA021_02380, partial [Minisyncoccia bacterium]